MIRILIADDHDGTREILRVLLRRHPGWEICGEANTNTEVLAKALELKPDVLVKDWVMPGMDNVELSGQLAKLLPSMSVVVFSFYDIPELANAAKAVGIKHIASKNLSALIEAIEETLRSSATLASGAADAVRKLPAEMPEDLD